MPEGFASSDFPGSSINMLRQYGSPPWQAALVHGGPGAPGTLACLGRELGKSAGILEPIQSGDSVEALILELDEQLGGSGNEALVLIGHSWGAWLALLYGARFPGRVRHLVLVSAGPLDDSYAREIAARRECRLNPDQRAAFSAALLAVENRATGDPLHDEAMRCLQKLSQITDNYQLSALDEKAQDALSVNAEQYAKIWPEAAALRRSGALIKAAKALRCPITVLHGADDPHPAAGVVEPLIRAKIRPDVHIFPRCGHSPFLEVHAAKAFLAKLATLCTLDPVVR